MPVSVNANATSTPPQFEVTITSPDGSAITAVTLSRQASGVTAPTRVQPTPGAASRFIADPEGPWDTSVVYVATTTSGAGTVTESSAAVTLTPSPLAIWAIHPTVPGRSIPLDVADFSQTGIAELGDVTYKSQATLHPILGGTLPTLTKVGNRQQASGSMSLTTVSLADQARLLALLNDETPILIREPDAWGWGFDEGYYAVADVDLARRLQYGPEQSRTVKLPLQKVAAPAGVQQSSWDWGGMTAANADFGSVSARYPDWNALTGNMPTS